MKNIPGDYPMKVVKMIITSYVPDVLLLSFYVNIILQCRKSAKSRKTFQEKLLTSTVY